MTEPQILSFWLSLPMKFIKAEFPPPSPTCTPPQKITLFLLSELLLLPVPNTLRPLALPIAIRQPLLLPHAVPILLTSAGIIGIMLTELRNAEHCVLGQETSCHAGGRFHSTCQFYVIFSRVSSRQAFFSTVSGGLPCLHLCFSSTCLQLYLWSETSHS